MLAPISEREIAIPYPNDRGEAVRSKFPNRDEREPNLLDFVPKNVWREVYQGRWTELRQVQKAEFVIEVSFCALFFGGLSYFGVMRDGGFVRFIVSFTVVGAILAVFFWLLSRSIK